MASFDTADRCKLFAGISLLVLGFLAVPVQAQVLRVWGDNASNQIAGAPTEDLKTVAGGAIHSVALRFDGTPVLWGIGGFGPPPIPAELAADRFNSVSIGRDDVVFIQLDGTLAAFGRNAPIVDVPAGNFRAVTVAALHAVAIRDDGWLAAWGWNYPPSSPGPGLGLLNVPRNGPFKQVDSQVLYSLALHEDGTLYGWGFGPIGTNVFAGWTPTLENDAIYYVPGETFRSIAMGNIHALALRPDGTITGWGNASGGALAPPTHVRFKAIAAGWGFSIGLSTDETLWGWGTPVQSPFSPQGWTFASAGWTRYRNTELFYVPRERFKSISAGAFHVMAITAGRSSGP